MEIGSAGMKFVEEAKFLMADRERRVTAGEILEDVIRAVLGDKISLAKVAGTLLNLPEQIFWAKMEMFLVGIYSNEEDRERLCAKFDQMGKKEENAFRLIEIINRVESKQKVRYLIRATRCFMDGHIDNPIYFRICHVIMHAVDEDLMFLKAHIGEADFSYNSNVQGLLTLGLMHQSVIGLDGDQKYSFVSFAYIIYHCAVDDSAEMNCDSVQQFCKIEAPRTQIVLGIAKEEDVDDIFKDK